MFSSSTLVSAGGLLLAAGMASAQTFTDCNPLEKTCPCDAGLGTTVTTDFTKGKSSDWTLAAGTTLTYSPTDGAQFSITSTQAPTIESTKFIMFGKVSVVMKAAPGSGIVSSVVLESDDLDEIDWEWIGSLNTEVQTNFFGKGNTTTYDRGKTLSMADAVGSFHEYTVDWTADSIKWEIDGVVVRTVLYSDPVALYGKNFPQTPMSIKLGNWIGCLDAAAAADEKTKWTCEWAGGPKSGNGPFVMSVKSVTIQDYGAGGEYCYSDKSGSWQSITSNGKSSSGGSSSKSASASGSSTATAKDSSTKAGSSTASSSASASGSATTVSSSDSSATTLTSTVSASSGTAIVAAAATTATTSPAAQTTSSGAQTMKPKHKYGVLDLSVMGLGLVLGYLVM